MKLIKLTKGKCTKVDDSDYVWLSQWKWFYCKSAKRAIWLPEKKKQIQIHLHNLLMNPPMGKFVDHINGDRLDNQRDNLRICTNLENQKNKKTPKNNTSGFKGVYLFRNRWRAYIQKKFIGDFKSPQEAALTYNIEAKKRFGKFARLNKIGGASLL